MSSKEEIDDIVCEVMQKFGPDGHVDGHDVLTDFIWALLYGDVDDWKRKYKIS